MHFERESLEALLTDVRRVFDGAATIVVGGGADHPFEAWWPW